MYQLKDKNLFYNESWMNHNASKPSFIQWRKVVIFLMKKDEKKIRKRDDGVKA
ncbi:MAG: hypothetical protein ACTHJ5_12045 [Ilyomonas sp.]